MRVNSRAGTGHRHEHGKARRRAPRTGTEGPRPLGEGPFSHVSLDSTNPTYLEVSILSHALSAISFACLLTPYLAPLSTLPRYSYKTRDHEPSPLAYNADYQQCLWSWSPTHAEYAPLNSGSFDDSHLSPSSIGPGDVSWFQEHVRVQSVRPEHVALPEVELMPAWFDYGSLEPIVEWCDTADSLVCADSTSPSLSLVGTNDSSVASLNDEPAISHTHAIPIGSVNRNFHSRMDPVKRWLHDHPFDRYPTPEEKADLAAAAGLSSLQLRRRLTNLRKRERLSQ